MAPPLPTTCIFQHNREPWTTFQMPTICASLAEKIGINLTGTYGLLLPILQFWINVIIVLLANLIIGAFLATIIYYHILPTTGTNKNNTTANLLAFGVIIPSCILSPYAFIAALNIQNIAIRFMLSGPFIIYAFRCLEALFGFSPPATTTSPIQYAIYYASPVEYIFHHNNNNNRISPTKANAQDIMNNMLYLVKLVIIKSVIFSLLSHYGFEPFESRNATGKTLMMKDYWDVKHLGNCFIHAILFQLGLCFFGSSWALFFHITSGEKLVEVMNNPVLGATSPSDFWGRRWNLLVHVMLKRAVFKPIRKYSSSFVAYLGAFVASGLFHEYIIHLVFMYKQEPKVMYTSSCPTAVSEYKPQIGSNMAFFAWNGILIVIEKVFKRYSIVKSIGSSLPRFVVTFFIIMTALPVAHWFGNAYVRRGFFYDFVEGFPIVTKIA